MSREGDRINRDRIARAGHPEKPPLAGAQQFGAGADATLAPLATGPEEDWAAALEAVWVVMGHHRCPKIKDNEAECPHPRRHEADARQVHEALYALGVVPDPVLPGSRPYQWGGRGGAG